MLSSPVAVRAGVLGCAVVSCALIIGFADRRPSMNPMSRLATMESLVHEGTYAIDTSRFVRTIDKVKLDDHFYSSKPPVWSTFGAGVYAVLHHLFGLSFRVDASAATTAVTLVLGLLPHVVLLWYVERFLRLVVVTPRARLMGFAGFALGWLGVGYATTINNHTPAAAAALAACYHAYLACRSRDRAHLVGAGALAGLVPTLDLGGIFVSAAIAAYLLAYDPRRTLRWFAPAALPPLAVHFALTYAVGGSLVPIYLRDQLYLYPGSYWLAPMDLDALDEPKLLYAFHMLVGHHGLFTMTPLIALGAWELARGWRSGECAREARLALTALAAIVVFYVFTTSNYGGNCVGFRWLLVVTPLFFVLAARWLERTPGPPALAAFSLSLALSSYNALDALRDPWSTSGWHRLLSGSL
jgi:hypothetical protein